MELVNVTSSLDFESSKVKKKVPILTDQLMSTLLYIAPDTKIPAHSHTDFDEIHYIVQGNGEITIGDETLLISVGSLILVPKNKPHYYSTFNDQLVVLITSIVRECIKK